MTVLHCEKWEGLTRERCRGDGGVGLRHAPHGAGPPPAAADRRRGLDHGHPRRSGAGLHGGDRVGARHRGHLRRGVPRGDAGTRDVRLVPVAGGRGQVDGRTVVSGHLPGFEEFVAPLRADAPALAPDRTPLAELPVGDYALLTWLDGVHARYPFAVATEAEIVARWDTASLHDIYALI